jgi:UDP-glucuronate 4-epimerase
MENKTFLVTGAAGFIGFHLVKQLTSLYPEADIYGIDNLNAYYDPGLKTARLRVLSSTCPKFTFREMDLANRDDMVRLFAAVRPDVVLHMGAQAGVRYSIDNPYAYIDSNIVGFMNILEGCRHHPVQHLLYASSSSVYGANKKVPFSVDDPVDHPISLYAATKKSNELMAHTYAHLYGVPVTGLRFFTVYGPWGRPDMAYFKFTEAIYNKKPIDIYNFGDMKRDFTYIDDIVDGIMRLIPFAPKGKGTGQAIGTTAPYAVYNIGHNHPEDLMEMINILEDLTGQEAQKNMLPMQPGDVYTTYADIDPLTAATGFTPRTSLRQGLTHFISWYKDYYGR